MNKFILSVRIGFFVIFLLFTVACAVQTNFPPTSTIKPNPIATAVPTLTPQATVTVTYTAVLTILPSPGAINFTSPSTQILAKNLSNPDDLVTAPDGSLYISDISEGSIKELSPDGSIQTIVRGLSVPEGMAYLPGGRLIIVEQGKNRLLEFDFKGSKLSTFLTLGNTTGQEGVDGITLDSRSVNTESIIIPDSPNGILRRASLDGGNSTVIASGFSRLTGAWVEPDGSILVVDENTGYLTRIHPDGKMDRLARFSIPDDVIEDAGGNIYINTLGDHAVHVLTAQGKDIVLLKNISDPQGIALTADGNLAVSDPVNHRIIKIIIHN